MSNDTQEWLAANSGGSGGPGVYFGSIGDKVVGVIQSTPRKVPTEFGERLVIELAAAAGSTATKGTSGEDGPIEAGDEVVVWVKPGAMASAIGRALQEAGAKGLTEGDTLAVAYTADGEKRKAGWNAPKLYAAKYVPAKPSVSVDELI